MKVNTNKFTNNYLKPYTICPHTYMYLCNYDLIFPICWKGGWNDWIMSKYTTPLIATSSYCIIQICTYIPTCTYTDWQYTYMYLYQEMVKRITIFLVFNSNMLSAKIGFEMIEVSKYTTLLQHWSYCIIQICIYNVHVHTCTLHGPIYGQYE